MSYSMNLIIDIENPELSIEMEKRLGVLQYQKNQKKPIVYTLKIGKENLHQPPTDQELELFAKVDCHTRIYLCGHSCYSSVLISSCNYESVAFYFAQRLVKVKHDDPHYPLTFNLLACQTIPEQESQYEQSFAVQFHRCLAQKYHIMSTVTGRNRILATIPNRTSYLGKFTRQYLGAPLMRHCPGSKQTLRWDQTGQQIMTDSYVDKYKARILKLVRENVKFLDGVDEKFRAEADTLFNEIRKLCEEETTNQTQIGLLNKYLKELLTLLEKNKNIHQNLILPIKNILNSTLSVGPMSKATKTFNVSFNNPYETVAELVQRIFPSDTLERIPSSSPNTPLQQAEDQLRTHISNSLETSSVYILSKRMKKVDFTAELQQIQRLYQTIEILFSFFCNKLKIEKLRQDGDLAIALPYLHARETAALEKTMSSLREDPRSPFHRHLEKLKEDILLFLSKMPLEKCEFRCILIPILNKIIIHERPLSHEMGEYITNLETKQTWHTLLGFELLSILGGNLPQIILDNASIYLDCLWLKNLKANRPYATDSYPDIPFTHELIKLLDAILEDTTPNSAQQQIRLIQDLNNIYSKELSFFKKVQIIYKLRFTSILPNTRKKQLDAVLNQAMAFIQDQEWGSVMNAIARIKGPEFLLDSQ